MADTSAGSGAASPMIKEEPAHTPQPPSPPSARPVDVEQHSNKAVATLKSEHGARTGSPLRESSVPVPTTEEPSHTTSSIPKKRPAPSAARTKKGTATTMKKGPAAKRRKIEGGKKEDVSTKLKGLHSGKGTPLDSSPAPSARSLLGDVDSDASGSEGSGDEDESDGDREDDNDLYCICRRPDNGTFMIGCDGTCDDWFHGKCVGIPEGDKNLIDKYFCPHCSEKGVGRTSWKRVCRRQGCRKPARVAAGSKYCSDECGQLFFQNMSARTRGRDETGHKRSAAKSKSSANDTSKDLGARGGALSAGEIRSLLDESPDVATFQALGNAVLSPPATPENDANGKTDGGNIQAEFDEGLTKITSAKQDARQRHALLKDRIRFVGLVKNNAARLTAEKEVKSKDFCGYDRRLEWSEAEFAEWRESAEGKQIFDEGKEELFARSTAETNGADANNEPEEPLVCDRKRCMRHNDWQKLAIDALRFEVAVNGDRMRGLEGEEDLLKERALLRRVGRGEGWVEKHVPTAPSTQENVPAAVDADEKMVVDVDSAAPAAIANGMPVEELPTPAEQPAAGQPVVDHGDPMEV